MSSGFTRRVASFAADTPSQALHGEARDVLKLSLLDWAACGLAGVQEPVSRAVAAMALSDGGTPEATVLGHATRLPARAAALANGTASHALDYDDTHFDHIGHPSVAIFPAALALAEKTGASGAALLDAALIGMEASIRIGRFLGMGHYNHGFHQTATAGAFGACAAAARLMGLTADQTAHALGLTATRASGLKSQFGTMGKPYNAGIAAANGVECALLAAQGFVSRPDGIECAQGFADTHMGGTGDAEAALAGLGVDFRFRDVQHKFHACCHGTHPTLEALAMVMDDANLPRQGISSVVLTVAPKWLRVCDLPQPRTGLEAKFSYRLTSAMMLAGRDTGTLATFSDEACEDPELVSLRDRIRVETDDALTDTAAQVSVALESGASITKQVDIALPMAPPVKERKLRAKAASLIGTPAAEAIWSAIRDLERGDVSGFTTALGSP
jgi:2-methylcitrate dehydratase PrpD